MSAIENNANLLLCTDYSIEAVRSIPGNMATRCEFCSKRVVISSAGRRTRDEQQAKVICSACMEDTDLIPHGTDMQFQASEAIREQVRQHTGMEIEEFGDPMEIRKRLLEHEIRRKRGEI